MEKKLIKQEIDPFNHVSEIIKGLRKGALITTKGKDKVNAMTISWGQIGIEWEKLIFTTYVRTGRYTHDVLKDTGEFTLNIRGTESVGKILGYCGTKSGKDVDKVKELGLNLIKGNNISVPGIKELPLTLECRVIYSQLQDKDRIPEELRERFYPQGVPGDFHSANQDYHTMFFGEVVGAYLITEVDS